MTDSTIAFLLNDKPVRIANCDPNLSILQYLRDMAYLPGTKEGCGSGDCGACTVVVAALAGDELMYKSINACIAFIGSLHGKQLITVEHLKQGLTLHPVQQALVDKHGSQCGFCTPGFVMSSFALHKNNRNPDREAVVEALAGNLCRCTGYRSIIDAAMTPSPQGEADEFTRSQAQTIEQLKTINLSRSTELLGEGKAFYAPAHIDELAQLLLDKPKATLVAGGTDLALGVTQNLISIEQLVYLGNVAELHQITQSDTHITIGSAVPYSEFTPLLAKQYPELGEMILRIGSTQIRNIGTLGGNIGNASPIGDMPPALIALGATVTLRKGRKQREIAVEAYFKDYKVTDLAESEFIESVTIAKAQPGQQLKVYKISKRIDDDISAVLAAMFIEIDGKHVKTARLAFGGMAATPKRASACEAALVGQPWQQATIDGAKQALSGDFQPMSDVRASDAYRMKVAQNLIQKCYFELQNRTIETRVTHYA
ncbi:MAG: xanthine dehydrogenase small subunit [Alteromonadaceae bacterium]|jgi:xanthine dehydrogenase small subunit